jgi:hypothetical protein
MRTAAMLPATDLQPIPKGDALNNGQLAISNLYTIAYCPLPICLLPIALLISGCMNYIGNHSPNGKLFTGIINLYGR